MSKRFLSKKEVQDKIKLSHTEIARQVTAGKFPKPLRLGPYPTSRTVWWEHEIDAWMESHDKR